MFNNRNIVVDHLKKKKMNSSFKKVTFLFNF